MVILNTRNSEVLVNQLEVASTFFTRLMGLMGRKSFSAGSGLLIKNSGNSIHTFFMQFPIDLVFIDKEYKVRWVKTHVGPRRLVFAPLLTQTDCLELPAGVVDATQTMIGDILNVKS